jgi:hypothetical protein
VISCKRTADRQRVLSCAVQLRRPETSPLLVPSYWATTSCFAAAVDPATVAGYGPGRPTDFYLYVTASPCAAGVVAYAGVCATSGAGNRPIMGAVNLCPGAFDSLTPAKQLDTVVHELLHMLVRTAVPQQTAPSPDTQFQCTHTPGARLRGTPAQLQRGSLQSVLQRLLREHHPTACARRCSRPPCCPCSPAVTRA